MRITLTGAELEGFAVDLPAASVRLLLPSPGSAQLVMPAWNGNEFLLPDGTRPAIRTFTPRRVDPDALELDLDVVLHGSGAASQWAEGAAAGAEAAISGPGRGYTIDAGAPAFVLAGDETAIPAMSQLLELLPAATPVHGVRRDRGTRSAVRPRRTSERARGLARAHGRRAGRRRACSPRCATPRSCPTRASGSRARRPACNGSGGTSSRNAGLTRAQATVRGYWKHGRAGTDDDT